MEAVKSSVINKASPSNSCFGVSQFKKKLYRRHANNSDNGLGVGRIPVIKVEKKNEALPATKRCRKKFVLPEHIEEVTKDPPLYRCTICKRSFKEKLHSKYHEHCLTGKKPLICGVCDKGFITKSHLDYHLRIHTDTKPFECRYCQKKFAQKDKVKRHIRLTHFKERPHACTLCTKTFTSKQALQVHMNGHLRQRPFKCDLCPRSFSSNTVLQRHRLTHSAIRQFSCDACDKKFTLKSDLTIHQRVHSGIRPYQCTVEGCNKSFTLKTSYTRHLQTHSEIQDYECTICVLAFRRKDNLERHIRNFHPETMVEGRSQQIVSIVQPKNFLPRKSVSKGSSKKTFEHDINVEHSLGNIESGTDNNVLDKNRMNCDYPQVSDSNFVRSRIEEYQECSSRLESTSSRSVIVETVQNKLSKSLSSEGASVINDSSKENKLKTVENNFRKTSESILPYRTITPPAKLSENDRVNCVPTITKVTHIVHTTKTGIPNIETVITTRDVTKNKAKQSKEDERSENLVVEKPSRSKSVISYVPKSTAKTSKRSVECFRILKPSSDFVTTCSNLGVPSFSPASLSGGPSFDVFSARKQQMYNQGGSFANAFENLCQEILSEDTSRGATPSNNQKTRAESSEFNRVLLQQFNEPHNSKYYENNSETSRFSSNNCLQPYKNSGMVSDSCLLADNALDHNITDTLYEQQLNDNYSLHQMQNMERNADINNYVPHRDTCLESEQYFNYPNPNYSNYYNYQSTDNSFESFPVNERPRVSNFVQENNTNRLEGDTMEDHMNRLEDLRMDYRRFEDAYNRSNNVPPVTRSVIVDQPKPLVIPVNYGPRQVPLKKCLWTKSAFGNLLNDSSCAEVS
ncbi:hypothetical protein LSTR_LSTR010643 [Laodelphax striatellus]|uniref:C2H2-type domain-containing protein n=1 Tax=Laodelphax striatellus TaxID=195883 RepID=A0A482XPI1_LAOST|nr:hypothetical protein LSTR_LSTR010643 [Laodelphax striatellus]